MGIFVTYKSAIFSNLKDISTTLIEANEHPLWVTSIIVCNRGKQPIRFNLQKSRRIGTELELSCNYASTAPLTATYNNETIGLGATLTNSGTLAAFSIDGGTPPLDSRILIKNQTNAVENGIYFVSVVGDGTTPWVLIRTSDYDTPKEINTGDIVNVIGGTTNANTQWEQIASVTTIGTDPLVFINNPHSTIYYINELEVAPYSTLDIIERTGPLNIVYSREPYINDKLICFSNGYTQLFDCEVVYTQLNELI